MPAVERPIDDRMVLAKAAARAGKALGFTQDETADIFGYDRSIFTRGIDPTDKKAELAMLLIRVYRSLYVLVGKEGEPHARTLEGKHVVFTGAMAEGTREEMEGLAEELGAVVQKCVSGKTDFLVVGEKPGASKLAKAQMLGVRIISEEDFYGIADS